MFVYERTGTGNSTFEHKQTLKGDGNGNSILFGKSISLSGNYLIVGAPYDDPLKVIQVQFLFIKKQIMNGIKSKK